MVQPLAEQQELLQTPQARRDGQQEALGLYSAWEISAVKLQQLSQLQAAKAAAASPKQLGFTQNPPKAGASGLGDAVSRAQLRMEVKRFALLGAGTTEGCRAQQGWAGITSQTAGAAAVPGELGSQGCQVLQTPKNVISWDLRGRI